MKYDPINRRHFLQGLGKFSLALPLLPSLMSSNAQAANINGPKYFVFISSGHGGVDYDHMYPTVPSANSQVLYANTQHSMRWDRLTNLLSAPRLPELSVNGQNELSPVLGSFLNPWLNRINVIQGLDMLQNNGHHSAYLGNFHAHLGVNPTINMDPKLKFPPMPTIDVVMANSPSFYNANETIANPAMNFGRGGNDSWEIQAGQMVRRKLHFGAGSLFDSLFSFNDNGKVQSKINLIDIVHADYQRLTQSTFGPGKRISNDDKMRLQEFANNLNETETRLRNRVLACPNVNQSNRPQDVDYWGLDYDIANERWEDFIDVMMLGFSCGKSRIATVPTAIVTEIAGDWHQDYAHQHHNPVQQVEVTRAQRYLAETVFLKIIQRMNVDMGLGDGTTYLDQALVYLQQEAGQHTHNWNNMPLIMAGNAGGYFNTGYHVDYRNLTNSGGDANLRGGIPLQRWLRTALMAMKIPATEYAREGMYGYGDPYVDSASNGSRQYPDQLLRDCDVTLPLIVA